MTWKRILVMCGMEVWIRFAKKVCVTTYSLVFVTTLSCLFHASRTTISVLYRLWCIHVRNITAPRENLRPQLSWKRNIKQFLGIRVVWLQVWVTGGGVAVWWELYASYCSPEVAWLSKEWYRYAMQHSLHAENACESLIGKPEGKRPFGRQAEMWWW
jgi:hypothetical protein